MHFLLFTAAALLLLAFCILHCKSLQAKVEEMPFCQKLKELNDLTEPLGFLYHYPENVFSSTQDSWKRKFGNCRRYDELAYQSHTLLECEPIYFDYDGKTWLVECRKGQYGISAGAEVGIYHTDYIISPKKRSCSLFYAASDNELLKFSYRLLMQDQPFYTIAGKHWQLTGFCPGTYAPPQTLHMAICVTFPNEYMQEAFIDGLLDAHYTISELNICGLSVSFLFSQPKSCQPSPPSPFRIWYIKGCNRILSSLYLFTTGCFRDTLDRLTYLYFLCPSAFFRIVGMRKIRQK